MDIVMLGHSGVGKTSYVSLMYAAMRDGIQGFGLCAREETRHEELTATAEEVLRGRYPRRATGGTSSISCSTTGDVRCCRCAGTTTAASGARTGNGCTAV